MNECRGVEGHDHAIMLEIMMHLHSERVGQSRSVLHGAVARMSKAQLSHTHSSVTSTYGKSSRASSDFEIKSQVGVLYCCPERLRRCSL